MNDRGKIAFYLMSPRPKITNSEYCFQFRLVKDPQTNRVNDLVRNETIPLNLHNNFLTVPDTDKNFELERNLF